MSRSQESPARRYREPAERPNTPSRRTSRPHDFPYSRISMGCSTRAEAQAPQQAFVVVMSSNRARTQDGHARKDTRDVPRTHLDGATREICRRNRVASDCARRSQTSMVRKGSPDQPAQPLQRRGRLGICPRVGGSETASSGECTGERVANSLQTGIFRAVSKTVRGGFVPRGFESLPLRSVEKPHGMAVSRACM
jgi:hypothetical protein